MISLSSEFSLNNGHAVRLPGVGRDTVFNVILRAFHSKFKIKDTLSKSIFYPFLLLREGVSLLTHSAARSRPEPFDTLKALSSIEGLESKANPVLWFGKPFDTIFRQVRGRESTERLMALSLPKGEPSRVKSRDRPGTVTIIEIQNLNDICVILKCFQHLSFSTTHRSWHEVMNECESTSSG